MIDDRFHTYECAKVPKVIKGFTYGDALPPAACDCGFDDLRGVLAELLTPHLMVEKSARFQHIHATLTQWADRSHSAPLSSPETRMRFCECCHSDNSENGEAFYDICKDCLEILQSRPSSPDFDPMCEECCDPVIPCSRHKAASPPAELTEALRNLEDAFVAAERAPDPDVDREADIEYARSALVALWARQREEIERLRQQSSADVAFAAEINGERLALSSQLERQKANALTWQEALAIIEEDLTDRPSRSPAATSAIEKCVGVIDEYHAALQGGNDV